MPYVRRVRNYRRPVVARRRVGVRRVRVPRPVRSRARVARTSRRSYRR